MEDVIIPLIGDATTSIGEIFIAVTALLSAAIIIPMVLEAYRMVAHAMDRV